MHVPAFCTDWVHGVCNVRARLLARFCLFVCWFVLYSLDHFLSFFFPFRLVQVMEFHRKYLDIFQKSQSFIMRGDGPLPFYYRNFIAIMVNTPMLNYSINCAGRHAHFSGCIYCCYCCSCTALIVLLSLLLIVDIFLTIRQF